LDGSLPVLLISGYAEESLPNDMRSAHTGYLAKPFRYEDFMKDLRAVMETS